MTETREGYHVKNQKVNANDNEVAEWVADQLKQCGYPTKPCGMSWGVLEK